MDKCEEATRQAHMQRITVAACFERNDESGMKLHHHHIIKTRGSMQSTEVAMPPTCLMAQYYKLQVTVRKC